MLLYNYARDNQQSQIYYDGIFESSQWTSYAAILYFTVKFL